MEISGKVVQILPLQSGEGKNGTWRKQEFVIETQGNYPKKVCITLWGDKIDEASLMEGKEVKAFIDIESREFKGRWYTDVKAWKVEAGEQHQGRDMAGETFTDNSYDGIDAEPSDDDLPF